MAKSAKKKAKEVIPVVYDENALKQGYVVMYDPHDGVLHSASTGAFVVWGEDELKGEVAHLFEEIRDEYDLDDIVVLKIDETKRFAMKTKKVRKTYTEETIEIVNAE